jgi:hypothetical protein
MRASARVSESLLSVMGILRWVGTPASYATPLPKDYPLYTNPPGATGHRDCPNTTATLAKALHGSPHEEFVPLLGTPVINSAELAHCAYNNDSCLKLINRRCTLAGTMFQPIDGFVEINVFVLNAECCRR